MSVAGSNTYPKYAFKCNSCNVEFAVSDTEGKVQSVKCTTCHSSNVEMLYISFPTDGPGYQKDNGYSIDPKDPRICSAEACTACGFDCR